MLQLPATASCSMRPNKWKCTAEALEHLGLMPKHFRAHCGLRCLRRIPFCQTASNLLQAASLAMASPSFICSLRRDSSRRDSNVSNSSGIQWIHHAFGYFGHAHHERFASLDPETVLKGSDWARARAAPGFHLPLGDTWATSQVGRI